MQHQQHANPYRSTVNTLTPRMTWIAATALSVLALNNTAKAEFMAEFTGEVTNFSGPSVIIDLLDGEIVGSYRFDETTLDSDGSVTLGSYAAITDYRVEFSSGYTVSSTSGDILIQDASIDTDLYQVFSNALTGSENIGFVTLSPNQMQLQLSDSSGAALSSDALPLSLDLGDFDTGQFTLALSFGFLDIDVTAELTSFSIVPEPASLALLALGGLTLLRRRG